MDTLPKISQNIFAYSFVSEHSTIFFYFEKKLFLRPVSLTPSPPLADAYAKNAFLYVLPK